MDWSKTKSIFIIVFAILNIFLYSLYLERYNAGQRLEELTIPSIDEKLDLENITYEELPEDIGNQAYLTGKKKLFVANDVPGVDLQMNTTNENALIVTFDEPLPLSGDPDEEVLTEFVEGTIYEGEDYVFWRMDEEEQEAVFFQEINGKPLFYSDNGLLTLHFNEDAKVTHYEQTLFENVEEAELQKKVIPPLQAIHTLYQKQVLKPDTHIDSAALGYTEYVTVSENTVMFLPTWRIRATLADGSKDEYFVNAIKDGVVEVKKDEMELEE